MEYHIPSTVTSSLLAFQVIADREQLHYNLTGSLWERNVSTFLPGRLPESSNIEEFKENLMKGVDLVTDDERRWSAGIYGLPLRSAKLKDLSSFDASFFGVHPKQADVMDPQLRMMLEITYEAIVDAGINPSSVRGSRTGVFIGVSSSESDDFWTRDIDKVTGSYI